MRKNHRKTITLFLAFAFLFGVCSSTTKAFAQDETISSNGIALNSSTIFLPIITRSTEIPLMTGIYPTGWPSVETINNEMRPMDDWLTGVTGGRTTSIFGTFMTLNLTDAIAKPNVEDPLTVVWEAGYTPFVNLPAMSGDTASYVATSEEYERLITTWAKSYKNYADNGKRFAYIAPLQEMNGYWVSYGRDPTNYIRAFKRFQTIFAQQGVPEQSVKWVFAPNGWSDPKDPRFENYYPGDDLVDVVAISAYNFGYCNGGTWKEPSTVYNNPFSTTYGYYLDRMYAMTPSKPIFIAQTASSSLRTSGTSNTAEKERWLKDAYSYLSTMKNVRAIIYFNINKENCDFSVFSSNVKNAGYKEAVTSNGYQYIEPALLLQANYVLH